LVAYLSVNFFLLVCLQCHAIANNSTKPSSFFYNIVFVQQVHQTVILCG
jgi:hypothetical protein